MMKKSRRCDEMKASTAYVAVLLLRPGHGSGSSFPGVTFEP
jgi:hypothetical protein